MGFKDQRNMALQSGLNNFGTLLLVDGDIGDKSIHSLDAYMHMCQSKNTDVLEVALCGGRCSGFGGPNDSGDRLEWQAYLPYVDKTKVTPQQYWALYGAGLPRDENGRSLLNEAAMKSATIWERKTGVGGVEGTVGLSNFLDEEALYLALRCRGSLVRARCSSTKLLRVMIVNQRTGAFCIALLSDYGPHTSTKRNIDLSPGVMKKIDVKTDDIVVFYLLQE